MLYTASTLGQLRDAVRALIDQVGESVSLRIR